MKPIIEQIRLRHKESKKVVDACNTAILALQQLCEHNGEYLGHSHNDSEYKCTICDLRKYE